MFGKCNDFPIVWDLKTSKEIRLSHKIQSAVYKFMYCKLNKLDLNKVKSGVLLIPRDKPRTWDMYINTFEEEKLYLTIFTLLSNLFKILLNLNEMEID